LAARTNVTAIALAPGQSVADLAETTTTIDAANGMKVLTSSPVRHVLLRITNTHGSPHAVTIVAAPGAGNSRAQHGAAGPAGSYPVEADGVSSAIPATTGVRYVGASGRYFQTDGSVLLNFEPAHTGVITAVEWA
jgi:hypothetical protein